MKAFDERDINNYWKQLVDIKDEFDDSKVILEQMFLVDGTSRKHPGRKKVLHLLIPIVVSVGESLPEYEKVRFHFLHYTSIFEDGVTISTNACLGIREALVQEAIRGSKEAPFADTAWWAKVRRIISTNHESDLNERKDHTNHGYLVLNSAGKILKSDKEYVPSINSCRKFCKKLYELFESPAIQNVFLVQSISQKSDIEAYLSPPPLHIGWTHYNAYHKGTDRFIDFSFLSGFLAPEKDVYCTRFQSIDNDIRFNKKWRQPFSGAVDLELAIPLFAYDIFSIIKFFLPDYPSRCSIDESFRIVRRKQAKLFFIALKGEYREQIAEAYCGAFAEYATQSEKNMKISNVKTRKSLIKTYNARIHDGVSILHESYKKVKSFSMETCFAMPVVYV